MKFTWFMLITFLVLNTLNVNACPPELILSGHYETRGDYWLKNPSQIPKSDIGQYVAQHGILVPKMFGLDLKTAVASNVPLLARSEMEVEYAEVAGLEK